jgi:hypothetical protein
VRWTGRHGQTSAGAALLAPEVDPDVEHDLDPDADVAVAAAPAKSSAWRGRSGHGPESVAGFGARLVRSDATAALWTAASILIVMATVAGIVLALDLGGAAAGGSRIALAGAAQALAPQLTLSAAGIAAGTLLVLMLRATTLRRRDQARALLREIGWTSAEIRRSERAEVLVIGLPSALVGCYVLWFALTAAGLTDLDGAVSAALIAGLAVVAALLVTPRKAGASS